LITTKILPITLQCQKSVNFPHSSQAMDNKNCVLQQPLDSGNKIYNHKSMFSFDSICYGQYECFLYVNDAGCQKKIPDGVHFHGLYMACK
jgi:hypothetical protein